MQQPNLSIMGLYNFDNTIWQNLVLPQGINKDDVTLSIMTECSELSLIYPSVPWMKKLIGLWYRKNQTTWEKLLETITAEYSPIENYDRYEDWTDTTDRTDNTTHNINTKVSGKSSSNGTSSDEGVNTTHYTDNESEKAFNDTQYVGRVMHEYQGSVDDNNTVTTSQNSENSGTSDETGTNNRKEDGTVTHQGHMHGNIGVTTAMQMIKEQREIVMFNMIDAITQSFKYEFCVCVY